MPKPIRRRLLPTFAAVLASALPAAAGCEAEIGRARAGALVRRCLEVSPATRPPCNAANACALIQSEIERGCRLLGRDEPAWCADVSEDP